MLTTILWFTAGLIVLALGAELLVRGASKFALRMGIPPIVIGLTIVAYGTSTPEAIVSAQGALQGQADIALGNVAGSNIFNVLFILGVSALIAPLVVNRQMVWQEVPIMVGVSVLAILLALDGRVSRVDGVFMLVLLAGYTWMQVQAGLKEKKASPAAQPALMNIPASIGYMVGGLAALVFGARWLLDSSVTIARTMGVSELVIGLTIVAAGTSLPEVATSILATIRGERDIAVGNVVGSNIYNILGVLGLAAVLSPEGVSAAPAAVRFDLPVMLATAVACLPIFFTGHSIARWEGGVFLSYYIAYVTYLILDAQGHDALAAYSQVMLGFFMPLTLLTVMIGFYRHTARAGLLQSDDGGKS